MISANDVIIQEDVTSTPTSQTKPSSNVADSTPSIESEDSSQGDTDDDTVSNVKVTNWLNKELEEMNNKNSDWCNGDHIMTVCDPAYDQHYTLTYFESLVGEVKCVKQNCPNQKFTFGQLVKKGIRMHYCSHCKKIEGKVRCDYVVCDVCKVMEEDSNSGKRRSKRARN